MIKFAQIITLIAGLTGSVMGINLLFHQAGREAGDGVGVKAPCLDAIGEPTC